MQADVDPLVIFDMCFSFRLLLLLGYLDVGPDDVVGTAYGEALGELALVIGNEFPFRLFLVGTADFDGDTVGRVIVLVPDGSVDERVVVLGFLFFVPVSSVLGRGGFLR